jgi:hypothetical protein
MDPGLVVTVWTPTLGGPAVATSGLTKVVTECECNKWTFIDPGLVVTVWTALVQ